MPTLAFLPLRLLVCCLAPQGRDSRSAIAGWARHLPFRVTRIMPTPAMTASFESPSTQTGTLNYSLLTPARVEELMRNHAKHSFPENPCRFNPMNDADLKIIAITQFGMPRRTRKQARETYLSFLREALTTTCSPTVWPPESWGDFFAGQNPAGSK